MAGSNHGSVVEVCRVLVNEGLVKGFGHVSVRPGQDRYLITPKMSLALVEEADLVWMDVASGKKVEGKGNPPMESLIHTAVYRARGDVTAIIRAQPPSAEIFAILEMPIRVVHQFGAALLAEVAIYPIPEAIVTEEQARELARVLGEKAAVLIRGNGAVTVGRTVLEACMRTIYMEESASLQWKALQIGTPKYLSGEEIGRIGADILSEGQLTRSWNFYRRRAIG